MYADCVSYIKKATLVKKIQHKHCSKRMRNIPHGMGGSALYKEEI